MRFSIIHRIAITIIAVSALLVAGWFGVIVWGLVGADGPGGSAPSTSAPRPCGRRPATGA